MSLLGLFERLCLSLTSFDYTTISIRVKDVKRCIAFSPVMVNVSTVSVKMLSVSMVSVNMVSVSMLSVSMLSVSMQSVIAPFTTNAIVPSKEGAHLKGPPHTLCYSPPPSHLRPKGFLVLLETIFYSKNAICKFS